jgi:hypothetical protein
MALRPMVLGPGPMVAIVTDGARTAWLLLRYPNKALFAVGAALVAAGRHVPGPAGSGLTGMGRITMRLSPTNRRAFKDMQMQIARALAEHANESPQA